MFYLNNLRTFDLQYIHTTVTFLCSVTRCLVQIMQGKVTLSTLKWNSLYNWRNALRFRVYIEEGRTCIVFYLTTREVPSYRNTFTRRSLEYLSSISHGYPLLAIEIRCSFITKTYIFQYCIQDRLLSRSMHHLLMLKPCAFIVIVYMSYSEQMCVLLYYCTLDAVKVQRWTCT